MQLQRRTDVHHGAVKGRALIPNPREEMKKIVGSAKSLAEYAARCGLIAKRDEPEVNRKIVFNDRLSPAARERRRKRSAETDRIRRANFIAQGLTCFGKPRVRKQWPQFKGLSRKEYLKRYHAMQNEVRKQKRKLK